MNCPKCGSTRVKKNGKNKSGTQKWYCNECGHPSSEGDNPQYRPPINGVAMTDAERAKNYYWRKKALKEIQPDPENPL